MHVVYRVPDEHHTTTTVGGDELKGSIHHREMVEFVGMVTRDRGDGTCDIVIFPPDKAPVHVAGVKTGEGPGTFTRISGHAANVSARQTGGDRASR